MTNPELEYEVAGGFVRIVFRKSFAASGLSREQAGSKLSLSSHQVVTKLSLSIPTIGDLLKKMVGPISAKEMRDFKIRGRFFDPFLN